MNKQIEERIQELTNERNAIEIGHQKLNQEFNKKAAENQTRYAQITGGIAELQRLLQNKGENNHDDSIPTLNIGDRIAHVCAGQQPESR